MFQPAKRLGHSALVLILFGCFFQQYPQSDASVSNTNGKTSLSSVPKADDPNSVIANFLNAELKVREALNRYTFKRDVVLQTLGANGEVTGQYVRSSDFVFDDKGRRVERIILSPPSTIRAIKISKQDLQDLNAVQLVGVEIAEVARYRLTYVGEETIESRRLLAIDVQPQVAPNPRDRRERFFTGRVWLDPNTFQIVKIRGTVEPQGKQRFPVFETWREAVENTLAFPSRSEADDVLRIKNADVHYRIKVRDYDYRLSGAETIVRKTDKPAVETAKIVIAERPKQPNLPAAQPEVSGISTKKPTADRVAAQPAKVAACTTNRSAPPVGPYHWPLNEEVKVYFVGAMFSPEQRAALLDAMTAWSTANQQNGSGVTFRDAGETLKRMSCRGCLTVGRRDVHKRDKRSYAFFNPMEETEGRLLVSAWIDLDFGIKSPQALKGFMVHELAHGLGLWDCTTCKKKQTIMNGFPGVNRDNGLLVPSACDLATVKDIYHQEHQVAALKLQNQLPSASAETQSVLAQIGLAQPGSAMAVASHPSEVTAATGNSPVGPDMLTGPLARPTTRAEPFFNRIGARRGAAEGILWLKPRAVACKPSSVIGFSAAYDDAGRCGLAHFSAWDLLSYRP